MPDAMQATGGQIRPLSLQIQGLTGKLLRNCRSGKTDRRTSIIFKRDQFPRLGLCNELLKQSVVETVPRLVCSERSHQWVTQ